MFDFIDWPIAGFATLFFTVTGLLYARSEAAEARDKFQQAFNKWAQHLRGCPSRKVDGDPEDCECGLTEFMNALEGD